MTYMPSHISATPSAGPARSTAVMATMPSAHALNIAILLATKTSKDTRAADANTSVMGLSAKATRSAHSSLLHAVMITFAYPTIWPATHAGTVVHPAAIAASLVVLLWRVAILIVVALVLGVLMQNFLFELVEKIHREVVVLFVLEVFV